MELGSGPSEREEHLGRHEDDRKGGGEREAPGEQAQAGEHGHEPDADSGDELEGRSRGERGGQRGVHTFGDCLAGGRQLGATLVNSSEGSKGREPAQQLE